MKRSIISEAQIVKVLKEYEGSRDHAKICRELGIHKSTFYNWRKKYAGMDSQELKRLKELEEENRRQSKVIHFCLLLNRTIFRGAYSSFGQRPSAGYSLGATICGAMDAFTRAMAVELAPIRVNNIAAGVVKTNLWNNLNEEDRNGFYKHLESTLLLKRVVEAEDIARAFIYLMTQPYTTGQSLFTDGGAVLV